MVTICQHMVHLYDKSTLRQLPSQVTDTTDRVKYCLGTAF